MKLEDLTLDEIKEEIGAEVYDEELAKFAGLKLKANCDNLLTLDLINNLISNQDYLIKYINNYLLYGAFKEEFRLYLIELYKVILYLSLGE